MSRYIISQFWFYLLNLSIFQAGVLISNEDMEDRYIKAHILYYIFQGHRELGLDLLNNGCKTLNSLQFYLIVI